MSGGAELQRQLLPILVPAHRDDPLCPELPGSQHAKQPDCAVADDGNRFAGAGLSGDGGEPAGTQHVGGGQQVRYQILGRQLGGGDQGAVSQRHPHPLSLRTARGGCLPVGAGGLVAGAADLAGVVGGEERPHDKLTRLHRSDGRADLLHDPAVLMPHRPRTLQRLDSPVGPQVRSANAAGRQRDDGVGRLHDGGFGVVLHTDLTGCGHHGNAHKRPTPHNKWVAA